jgi:hypothetical protein
MKQRLKVICKQRAEHAEGYETKNNLPERATVLRVVARGGKVAGNGGIRFHDRWEGIEGLDARN